MKCIQVLLPALTKTKEQEEMTNEAFKSIVSFEHCVKVTVDSNKYPNQVASVWNVFLDRWRGKEYDYLCITANDVIHDPNCLDYIVRHLENHPDAGVVSVKVIRDKEGFKKGFGQSKYEDKETMGLKDPATMVFRRGVVEKVGRVDEYFPCEFVERDYLYRCKLAGYEWLQPDIVLEYHPPYSGTIGNDMERLNKAYNRYLMKWGGDADNEAFKYPMNDMNLDFTYCVK
jgi:hypothetical protein